MGSRGSFAVIAVALLVLAGAAGLGVSALLAGGDGTGAVTGGSRASSSASPSSTSTVSASTGQVSLRAGKEQVSPNERVDLTGAVAGAKSGVNLQVQRQGSGGSWENFPANAHTKSDGSFSTYVQIGRKGKNVLRVVSQDGAQSQPVTITVG